MIVVFKSAAEMRAACDAIAVTAENFREAIRTEPDAYSRDHMEAQLLTLEAALARFETAIAIPA